MAFVRASSVNEAIECPLCWGPAAVVRIDWRGDRIAECAAYDHCRGDWRPDLVGRDPYRWNLDRPPEIIPSLADAEERLAAWRRAAA